MIERRHSIALRRSGFSLTEMLVALGIIVLLMSVLLPTAMRLRSVGKQTRCMNNLRQIGAMYLVYAERNNDCIPLGTSRFKDPDHPGVVPYTPYRPPPDGRPYPWPNYHPENNQYLW